MALLCDTDIRAVRFIRRLVRGLVLFVYGGSEDDASAMELATGEVLTNVTARQPGPIEIDLLCDEAKIELTVHNRCARITEVPAIPSTPPSGRRGQGLYIAGQLTDECEVIPNGRSGFAIRLAKNLRRHLN